MGCEVAFGSEVSLASASPPVGGSEVVVLGASHAVVVFGLSTFMGEGSVDGVLEASQAAADG